MMRDEPLEAAIPESFEPSSFDSDKLQEAEARLLEVEAMDHQACDEAASREFQKTYDYHTEKIKKAKQLKAKYDEMLEQVVAWVPPTNDHVGLKDFMKDQLKQSINHDCAVQYHEEALSNLYRKSASGWKVLEMLKIKKDISYHTEHHKMECERTEARNKWLKQLRESL